MMQYQPVIIIGAPRSGTNMLRDVLTSFTGIVTWPCDEINYVWRHGNVRYPSDEFMPDMARPEVCRYIRGQFDWVARKYQAQTVVEKICAMQWKRCVDKSAQAFDQMQPGRWIEVAYEDFVRRPESELGRMLDFLELNVDAEDVQQAVFGVQADNVGKERAAMGRDTLDRLMSIIGDTLGRYGF